MTNTITVIAIQTLQPSTIKANGAEFLSRGNPQWGIFAALWGMTFPLFVAPVQSVIHNIGLVTAGGRVEKNIVGPEGRLVVVARVLGKIGELYHSPSMGCGGKGAGIYLCGRLCLTCE